MRKNVDFCKSKSDDWKTPSVLYKKFMDNGFIDPCPFKSTFNGLDIDYHNKNLFINPHYSDIYNWCIYALKQYDNGCNVVLLIPSRTDTKYFHLLIERNPMIYFFKGRLHFNDSKESAPFPSVLICLFHSCLLPIYCPIDINTLIKL